MVSPTLGWLLLTLGLAIAAVGLVLLLAPRVPWLGRLPGDILIERENVRLYIPLMTCLLVSVVLTVIVWLVRLFSNRP